MLQIWFCRSGLCFCNFFVLTYVTAGVSHHMFSPGFLPRVLPQYFYDSVSHVCRCFNRGCSFLAADAAASSSTLGSCTACFSTGSSVLLLPCEFTFLWSILLRLQMGYSFAACISWFASASGFYLCSARLRFTCPALLFSPIFTFLADFTSCGAMSHRVLTSWVVCDMLHLWFRSVFAT